MEPCNKREIIYGTTFNKITEHREHLKCWECGYPHYFFYCKDVVDNYIISTKIHTWQDAGS